MEKSKKLNFVFTIIAIIVFIVAFYVLIKDRNKNESNLQEREIEYLTDATILTDNFVIHKDLPYIHREKNGFEVYIDLKNYTAEDYNGKKAVGITTSYLNYKMFLGDKEIFSYQEDKNQILGSGGKVFFVVDLPKNENNDKLKIEFEPMFPIQGYLLDPLLFGDRSNIVLFTITDDYPGIVSSSLLIFLFIFTLIIYLLSQRIGSFKKRALGISLSSFLVAVYVFSNLNVTSYFLSHYRGLICFLEFTALIFFPYPLIKVIEDEVGDFVRRILNFCSFILYANYFVQFYIVITDKAEFRQMLFMTHLIIITIFINIIFCIAFTDFKKKKDKIILLLSLAPAYVSMGIAYLIYSVTSTAQIVTIFAFSMIIFVIVQIYIFIIDYIDMNKENSHSEVYKKMTNIDSLTGLKNRHAFNIFIKEIKENPKKMTLVSIDLNNLKVINDTLGHSYGDKVILEVGNFLKENASNCEIFRLGGDEFLLVSMGKLKEDDIQNLKLKRIYIEEVSELIDVTFSIGICYYDMEKIKNIDDAIVVADLKMYENKDLQKKLSNNKYEYTRQ